LEDYVAVDNPVRAIEAYVEALDLVALKFCHADRAVSAGQPPYDPADMLKLYLYGYLNHVRSSRSLAREAARNMEVIWLLKSLTPSYRTIGSFRSENAKALTAANRDFVLIARELGLFGGTLVAIDGTFMHGNASAASITTRKELDKHLAQIERDIEAYNRQLDLNDTEEAASEVASQAAVMPGNLSERIAALLAKRDHTQAQIKALDESGETQVSRVDPDARKLSKAGNAVAGFNVQIAVDDKHKLIVASEVVNDGNDSGQLHAMADAAKAALGAAELTVLADGGYYNGETLKACEDDAITAYVPPPQRGERLEQQGRHSHKAFTYDAQADVYRCPQGEALAPMRGFKTDTTTGKLYVRYTSRKSVCDTCPLRAGCLTEKADRRTIYRWEHEAVIERHQARMQQAGKLMRRRSGLAEHPFGTLKHRAGHLHFLVRGFDKVRGEWSLMALCYNFTRVLNILGLDRLRAHLAARRRLSSRLLFLRLKWPVNADSGPSWWPSPIFRLIVG
jgi:transposase